MREIETESSELERGLAVVYRHAGERRSILLALFFVGVFTTSFSNICLSQTPPPVLSPVEQLKTFQLVESGLRIELVAAEPMVQDPVVISFDDQGRLWVVEMRGFMRDIGRRDEKYPDGRVSVLEDTDGDGRMDRTTVFADDLILPRAILVYPDGVLIGEHKALSFFEDLDGDMKYDRKAVIDPNYARDSIEHSANGLYSAMDNWIYNAKEGHRYRRFNGKKKWIRRETEERGQWGICQDDFGRLIYNYNHSQLHGDQAPPNLLTRNPNHVPSSGLRVGITSSNRIFPIRPTPAANRGYIPGVLDEEGRIKEFTSASAPLVYRGDLFEEFRGNSFVCEPVGNLISRSVVTSTGIGWAAQPAYPNRDFLASTDERFRPCWLTTGPDGALYISDMYRGVVQDGPHMSPYLREHSTAREMDQPIHLGRIWRIVPDDFEEPERANLPAMSVEQLVAKLAHPSGWWRDQAQRRLVALGMKSAIPEVRKLLREDQNQITRLHALWVLEGLGISDVLPLVEMLRTTETPPALKAALLRVVAGTGLLRGDQWRQEIELLLKGDVSPELALQLTLTIGDLELEPSLRHGFLRDILLPRAADPLMRDAALSSLEGEEVAFLNFIWSDLNDEDEKPGEAILVETLSSAAAKSGKIEEGIAAVLNELAKGDPPNWKQRAVARGKNLYLSNPDKTTNLPPLNQAERKLFVRGRQVYLTSCAACHGCDGAGMKLMAPPLARSDWVTGSEERLVRVMFHGLSGPITVSGKRYAAPEVQPMMPPLASLNNGDIAAVLTYIRREWGNAAEPISKKSVSRHRIEAQGRTLPWTESELEPFAQSKLQEKKTDSE